MAAGSVPVLRRAARRRAGGARGRPRIPARHLSGSSARLLARRDRLRCRRTQRGRRLPALADLRDRDLLGGVRARTLNRRGATRGARGASHGGHRRLHGADPGFRARHSDHAALGAHPAALLARGGRGSAGVLAPACDRDRPAAAHYLCGPDPGRVAGAVHALQCARADRPELIRSADRGPRRHGRHGTTPDLARGLGRRAAADARASARAGSGDGQSRRLAAADRIDLRRPCRPHRAGRVGGRMAVAAA